MNINPTDPLTYLLAFIAGGALFIIALLLDLRVFLLDATPDKYHHQRYLDHVTAWLLLASGLLLIVGILGLVFAIVYQFATT